MSNLDSLIRQDVEHGTFSPQNIFNDEYLTPQFYTYAKQLEEQLEKIPKWHDLREDPNDLPPASKEDDSDSEVVLSDNGDKVYCSLLFGTWYNYHTDRVVEVVAWTELPRFKESK